MQLAPGERLLGLFHSSLMHADLMIRAILVHTVLGKDGTGSTGVLCRKEVTPYSALIILSVRKHGVCERTSHETGNDQLDYRSLLSAERLLA